MLVGIKNHLELSLLSLLSKHSGTRKSIPIGLERTEKGTWIVSGTVRPRIGDGSELHILGVFTILCQG